MSKKAQASPTPPSTSVTTHDSNYTVILLFVQIKPYFSSHQAKPLSIYSVITQIKLFWFLYFLVLKYTL